MGRKCEYTDKHLELANDYLEKWEAQGTVPQIARLAIHCEISKTTLYEWEKREECAEFANVCARVRVMQEAELVDCGLNRTFDSGLSKLMLMKHGYSEKQEVDHTTNGENIAAPFGFVDVSDTEED